METLSKAAPLLKKETATLQRVAGYARLSKVKGHIDRSVYLRDHNCCYQMTHLITLVIPEVPGSGLRSSSETDPMGCLARALPTGRSLHIFPEALLERLGHTTLHRKQRKAQIHTCPEIWSDIQPTKTSKCASEHTSGGTSLMTSPEGASKGIVPSLGLLSF